MPVHRLERIEDGNGVEIGIRIDTGDAENRVLEILYADIPGNSWNANRLRMFADRAQEFIDRRVPRSELPDGDIDKESDPALPGVWWDGDDIVYRQCLISDVRFDGKLIFTLTRQEWRRNG